MSRVQISSIAHFTGGVLIFFLFFLSLFSIFGVTPPAGREPSAPFVTGDGFRFICDQVFDEIDSSLDASSVMPYDVVFVQGDWLKRFFDRIHPFIQVPYVLVSHNSDDSIPGPFAHFLDDESLIMWFGTNYDGTLHPKLQPIPFGAASRHWPNGDLSILLEIKKLPLPRTHFAYLNYSYQTCFTERWPLLKQLAKAPFCYRSPRVPFKDYLFDLASSHFSISPRGIALETFRLWESLYLGTIPIVKTSSLDGLYADLPIVIVNDWSEVTEEFLKAKQEEMKKNTFAMEKLSMNYWTQLIRNAAHP